MADYLSSNILAQSYVHVEPEWLADLSSEEKNIKMVELEKNITTYANQRMPFFLHSEIRVKVEITEGSIVVKATAFGSLMVMLGHVPGVVKDYPVYRQSVKSIVADAVRVADALNTEVLYYTNSRSKKEIKSIEARKGIFGKLDRLNNKINEVTSLIESKDCNPAFLLTKILDIHKQILESLDEIKDPEDLRIVKSSIASGITSINLRQSNFKIKNDKDRVVLKTLISEKEKIMGLLTKKSG